MNLNLRNLARAGFRSTSIFSSPRAIGLLYRCKGTDVEFTSGYCPNRLGVFRLTKSQFNQFKRGRLSLVPPGFCNPSGGKSVQEAIMLFEGTVRSVKHLERIFATFYHSRGNALLCSG